MSVRRGSTVLIYVHKQNYHSCLCFTIQQVEQAEALFLGTPPTDTLDTIAADQRPLDPQSGNAAAGPRDHSDGDRTDVSKDDPMSDVQSQRSLDRASPSYQPGTATEGVSLTGSSTEQLRHEATPVKETLVDRLYATSPGAKQGTGTAVKKRKQEYLYRRTAKV